MSIKPRTVLLIPVLLAACPAVFAADAVAELLSRYGAGGTAEFSAERGRTLWTEVRGERSAGSCADCHTGDLTRPGRHVRTGKAIEPLAPSVNPERLTDPARIEKWFLRNCKGTWGRECTAREKGDFLLYIRSQ